MKPKTPTLLPSENSEAAPSQKPKSPPPEPTGRKAGGRRKFLRKVEVGDVIYSLTVLSLLPKSYALCQCVCGKTKAVRKFSLAIQETKSCGCLQKHYKGLTARIKNPNPISRTKEYRIYHQMRQRCQNSNSSCYPYYGGRGIKVCSSWDASFDKFLLDMGKAPSTKMTIDRIDPDGDYCPENCRWATRSEQTRNRKCTVKLTLNGVTKPAAAWADELHATLGLRQQNINDRRYWGWTDEEILTTPVTKSNRTKK